VLILSSKIKLNSNNGFTLIELMIVIAIIGALAAIAIPSFIAYRDKAYCQNTENDANNTLAAISSYYSEPDNTIAPGIDILISEENLSLNNSAGSVLISIVDNNFTVTVTNESGRCPRGTSFTATLGGDKGVWN